MPKASEMSLAAFFYPPGSHSAGWKLPSAITDGDMELDRYVHFARTAERGLFDTMFLQDSAAVGQSDKLAKGLGMNGSQTRAVRLEPLTLMPALAMATEKLGLIATCTTTYNEPYNVARKFATLDHISNGRAGWNLVTSQVEDEAANFGFPAHVAHADRYSRAGEFYDIVVGLWDSWEDDALLYDKASGRYFDIDKVHVLNHRGQHFNVRGPLNVARCPQGRPVVAQAGSSEPGKELAARGAEIVFTAQSDINEAKAFYNDVKGRMARYGRTPDEMKILPGLNIVVGRTMSEAEEKFEELQSLLPDEVALQNLSRLAGGLDLTKFPLDGPMPELPPSNMALARQAILVEMARRENLTIRQLARRYSVASGHHFFYGTASQLADVMQEWFEAGAADGFTIITPYFLEPLENFVDLVIPELQRRKLFRDRYRGNTLRDHLGLAVPANQFAKRH